MGTVRFITSNLVEVFGSLKNGTGGGAPARDEVAPYVMDNALLHDRRVLWQQSSGNAMLVHLDLGANRSVAAAGLFGHRPLGPTGIGINSCVVRWAASAGGYPPGAWTNAGTLGPFSARDSLTLFTQVSGRYWEFDLDGVFDAFTLGKLLLAATPTDLGINPSIQDERIRLPNIVDRTAGEDPIVTIVGDIRSHFALHFRMITGTVLAQLRALAGLGQSFILINRNDVPYEVMVEGDLEFELAWISGSTELYNATLRLEQLG